jgi:DNA-binding transcriptional LysR family regulator
MDELRAIRILLKVAELGSFVAASRALGVAPSVVTREVMELEAQLGLRLLNRTTRRVWATGAGEDYVSRMRGLVADIDRVTAETSASAQRAEGRVCVAAPPGLVRALALPVSVSFRRRHPDVTLELVEASLLDKPDDRADLSLLLRADGRAGGLMSGDFVVRSLAFVRTGLFATPDYLGAHGRPRHPAELEQVPCLMIEDHPLPAPIPFTRLRSEPVETVHVSLSKAGIQSSDAAVLMEAALLGEGLLGMPSYAACALLQSSAFEPVLPAWQLPAAELLVVYRSPRQMRRAARLLLDDLIVQFGGEQRADPWNSGALGDRCVICALDCRQRNLPAFGRLANGADTDAANAERPEDLAAKG